MLPAPGMARTKGVEKTKARARERRINGEAKEIIEIILPNLKGTKVHVKRLQLLPAVPMWLQLLYVESAQIATVCVFAPSSRVYRH